MPLWALLTYGRRVIYDLGNRRRRAVRPSPVFLAFVAVAALAGLVAWQDDTAHSLRGDLAVFVFVLALWVVSLSLHEFGHAYAAYRGGDRSVEAAGYLTLNPARYAHPVLSIVLPLLFIVQGGIGLPGGAVYLHRHSLRSRTAQTLAAAAGPLINVAFAAVTLGVVTSVHGDVVGAHLRFWSALAFFGFLQVTAAVLNLLPVPGLDGWAILEPWMRADTARAAEPIKPWGLLGVIVLLQIPSLNSAFFHLVDSLVGAGGVPRVLVDWGHIFFRFWQNPRP